MKITTGEQVCDWACENSCRFCFGNLRGHQTDPCTRGWAEETRRRQTRLSHTFHTHSFSETKAGKFRFAFTPRNTQNTHGPLVRPLKPADMFFVCTQIVPHSQMQPPPRHLLAQGQTQILHLLISFCSFCCFWQMSKNAAGEPRDEWLCARLRTFKWR